MYKKFFVVSDIHSFYTPLKKALDKSEFDPNNENHWLIICGDSFDRGNESKKVLRFLMSLERKILIKGNHDILLEDCCLRGHPEWYDISNGTVKTIEDIGGSCYGRQFDECCDITWNVFATYRGLLRNYFETKNYIFVHSWIPVISGSSGYYRYDANWRNANSKKWGKAMWYNPFEMCSFGLNMTGKTIVFGHWHCSAGHKMLGHCDDEFNSAIWEPCYFDDAIGIDRCTAHTGEVNVVVLEDKFME